MEKYIPPSMELTVLFAEDVIMTSVPGINPNPDETEAW